MSGGRGGQLASEGCIDVDSADVEFTLMVEVMVVVVKWLHSFLLCLTAVILMGVAPAHV